VYELISSLRPYFFSLREIEKNVSLDIKIPGRWNIENVQYIASQYKSVGLRVQDKNDKNQLISIISVATEDGYKTVRTCAVEIIKYNSELEEKDKLFREKVKELEALFKKESLDKLKDITFIEEDGQENTEGIILVGKGDEEGSEAIDQPQEDVD
jgi:hypothetical protein